MSKRYGEYEQVNGSTVNAAFDSIEKLEKQLENSDESELKALARAGEAEAQLRTKDKLAIIVNVDLDEAVLRAEVAEEQLEAVRWHIPDPDNPPLDSNLLIQVDLSDGSIDEAYVYLSDDDCDTLHYADDYGDVYTAWQWSDVSRYIKTAAIGEVKE